MGIMEERYMDENRVVIIGVRNVGTPPITEDMVGELTRAAMVGPITGVKSAVGNAVVGKPVIPIVRADVMKSFQ